MIKFIKKKIKIGYVNLDELLKNPVSRIQDGIQFVNDRIDTAGFKFIKLNNVNCII